MRNAIRNDVRGIISKIGHSNSLDVDWPIINFNCVVYLNKTSSPTNCQV